MDMGTIESIVKLSTNYGLAIVLAIILLLILIRDKNKYQDIITESCKKAIEENLDKVPSHPISTEEYSKYDEEYATLQALIEKTRVEMNAARISVIMYHNGGHNLVGIPFQRMTVIAEAVAPGLARIINEFKDVQRSSYVFLHKKLQEDSHWLIPDIEKLDNTLLTYGTLKNHSSSAACFIATHDIISELPIGFICVEYMHCLSEAEQESVLEDVESLGDSVSALMGVNRK